MPLTFRDVCDRLKMLPEPVLLEVLDISSEDIVDKFEAVIEERYDYLAEDLEDM